jgi:hypothetical protein
MKKSVQFAGILVGALAFASLFGLSANAETRHQDESSWRESHRGDRYDRDDDRGSRRDSRRDDRDFLSGYVQRIDYRRGVVVLRTHHNSRPIVVEMVRRNRERGLDLEDLRRGDRVTFIGDWSRGGVFTAWRIDDIDARNGRGRGRW